MRRSRLIVKLVWVVSCGPEWVDFIQFRSDSPDSVLATFV